MALERRLSSNTSYVAISNFTISFISASKTQKYSAGIGFLPIGFDSKKSLVVNGTNNRKWLEMIIINNNFNSLTIIDYSTNTTFQVNNFPKSFNLNVIAPINFYTTKSLLTDGCTKRLNDTVVQNIFKLL